MDEKKKRPREDSEEQREFRMPSSKKAKVGKNKAKFKKKK